MLSDFYENTTKKFDVEITLNGSAPDITGDVVKILFKDTKETTDANAVIDENADVATEGASGVAKFNLTPAITKVTPKRYYYEIRWVLAGVPDYVLESKNVDILDRITDLV